MPLVDSERILKFHNEVDRVAKLMCEELHVDPDEVVRVTYGADWTPFEAGPGWPPPDRQNDRGLPTVGVQRWRTFRPIAARIIAGQRAFHKFVLTEC